MSRRPNIVDPTPEQNAQARELCRRELDAVVDLAAAALGDQPLSIKQLMARLLIEDFAALDNAATSDWLDANRAENFAALHLKDGEVRDLNIEGARRDRAAAFTKLAEAEIARGEVDARDFMGDQP